MNSLPCIALQCMTNDGYVHPSSTIGKMNESQMMNFSNQCFSFSETEMFQLIIYIIKAQNHNLILQKFRIYNFVLICLAHILTDKSIGGCVWLEIDQLNDLVRLFY